MLLLFLYGPVASGKLTIGRLVAERTGIPLFHNHLIVDAVAAVFPFGSEPFVRLREGFWLETMGAAAQAGRSLIFTFAPEPTVAEDFPERAAQRVTAAGGRVLHVALDLDREEQERRLVDPARGAFGKLRSPEILRELRSAMAARMAAMPVPDLRIDTGKTAPTTAAEAIVRLIGAHGLSHQASKRLAESLSRS